MELQSLCFDYDKKKLSKEKSSLLFCDFSLELSQGKINYILGSSGVGKSSLLKLILGLEKPFSGKIIYDGANLETVGYVSAESKLLDFYSVYENLFLCIYSKKAKEEKDKLIREEAEKFSITKLLGRKALSLSSGQRKKVELIRALINRPRLLILDEAEGHLDEPFRESFRVILREYQRQFKATCIMVSHNLSEAFSLADRIFVMKGKPVEIVSSYDLSAANLKDKKVQETLENEILRQMCL